jgi:predicted  nucleic acid-binding Zn-ribbon protein
MTKKHEQYNKISSEYDGLRARIEAKTKQRNDLEDDAGPIRYLDEIKRLRIRMAKQRGRINELEAQLEAALGALSRGSR